MLKIAVCYNEPAVVKQIGCCISLACELLPTSHAITYFPSGEELLEQLYRGQIYDIIYMDIDLKGMSGIDVGKHLRRCLGNTRTLLIFIAESGEHAPELFECNTYRLLIRPISQAKFTEYFMNACRYLGVSEQKFLQFKEIRGEKESVPFEDIIYLESTGRVIQLVTYSRRYHFYGKLAEYALYFEDEDFIRVHNSILMNFNYISVMRYDSVRLDNGELKDISGPKRKAVREAYLQIRKKRNLNTE